jgi:hypothetical protein
MSADLTVHRLAMLGREVTSALAAGIPATDADGMLSAANRGRLFTALEEALGGVGYFDWIDGRQRVALNEEWARLGNAVLVEDLELTPTAPGLFLVMAFILESIKLRDMPGYEELDDAED